MLAATQFKSLPRIKASEYLLAAWGLSYTAGTLAVMGSHHAGPAYFKHGKRAMYPVAELDRWAQDRLTPQRKQSNGKAVS